MSKSNVESQIWDKINNQKKLARVYNEIGDFVGYSEDIATLQSASVINISIPDQSKYNYASDAIQNMDEIFNDIKKEIEQVQQAIDNINQFKQKLEDKMHILENEARSLQDNYNNNNKNDSDYGNGIQIVQYGWNWR
jgi:chromosome segregation ATPase